jgi:hypothetical protein
MRGEPHFLLDEAARAINSCERKSKGRSNWSPGIISGSARVGPIYLSSRLTRGCGAERTSLSQTRASSQVGAFPRPSRFGLAQILAISTL